MTRYWQAEPRADLAPPPAGAVVWAVTVLVPRTTYVRARTAAGAAGECGATLSTAEVRRASDLELARLAAGDRLATARFSG